MFFNVKKIDYSNQLVIYRNFLEKKDCQHLIDSYNNSNLKNEAFTNLDTKNDIKNMNMDINNKKNKQILKDIKYLVDNFNKNFNFNIKKNLSDSVVIKYNEGNYAPWHQDLGSFDGTVLRKINAIILLNDKKDFEGGDFEVFFSGIQKIEMNQGDLVILLPFLQHRVTKIEKGTRYSFVTQAIGSRSFK